nr:calmegin-like [Leptinotarsa decemlineata]
MNIRINFIVLSILFLGVIGENGDDDVTVETVEEPTSNVPYESPTVLDPRKVYFAEHFDDVPQFEKRWMKSQAKKEGIDEDIAKYDGVWEVEQPHKDAFQGDSGLVLKSKAKHAAIAAALNKPFVFSDKPLIVQYEVLLQDGQECGGAYLKLISEAPETKNLQNFHDKTPYTIMFGPDKCGNDHKLHFIFKHKNPRNGTVEEKHCQKPKERLEEIFSDKLPHLYTLVLRPDNTFEILVDKKIINSGSLLEDFVPPVNPPAEIDDPNDKKPADWDESCVILAPPMNMNSNLLNVSATYTFYLKLAYKKWHLNQLVAIGRHSFLIVPFVCMHIETSLSFQSAVGFELWSMSQDILFDNIIITEDIAIADKWAEDTFSKKRQKIAKDSESVIQRLAALTNDYPFLWGVYILVLAVPVVFLLYLCCKPASSSASHKQEKEELSQAAEKKKTDQLTEDVEEEQEGEEEEKENNEGGEEEAANDDEEQEKNSPPDSEEDNEAIEEESASKPSVEGARKRKVRKD